MHPLIFAIWAAAAAPSPPPPFPGGDAAECAVAVQVALAFGRGERWNTDPVLSARNDADAPLDCSRAFHEAGFPAYVKPVHTDDHLMTPATTSLSRPRLSDATHITVEVTGICGDLCNEGHTYTLEASGQGWVITGHAPSWIS